MCQACDARYDSVPGQRGGYTVVTSVWADGTRGAMFINVVAGKYKQEKMNEFNDQHIGRCYINVSEVDTHFMTSESTLVMFENLFVDAFRLQRAKYGLTAQARGALQADDFSGNRAFTKGQATRRDKFSNSCNVALPLKKKSGWSGRGSCCDGIHDKYRKITDHCEDQVFIVYIYRNP